MKFLCLFAVLLVAFPGYSSAVHHPLKHGEITGYLNKHGDSLLSLMKKHVDLSLSYLLTSTALSNQTLQRPGLGKYIRSLSDEHWEEGLSTLKKYFHRGGTKKMVDLSEYFGFKGENKIVYGDDYYNKLVNTLLTDSKDIATDINELHAGSQVAKNSVVHDADFGHFLEEKMEKEAKCTRVFAGYKTVLHNIGNNGLALEMFDTNI